MLSDKFVNKKVHFVKHFVSIPDFLELQCLVDDLVYFLELSIFINASLPWIVFDKVEKGLGHEKKAFW